MSETMNHPNGAHHQAHDQTPGTTRRPGRTAATATVAAAAALALTGCAGGDAAPVASKSAGPALTMSAPPTADARQVTVVVDSTGLPAGTTGRLYAYGGTWGTSAPTCTAKVAPVEFEVRGGPQPVPVSLPHEGVYYWALAAPGYTTACGDERARTIVRGQTDLQLRSVSSYSEQPLSTYDKPLPAGRPFRYAVFVGTRTQAPPPAQWKVTVRWYGPFTDQPAASAAGCDTGAPIAHEQNVTTKRSGVLRLSTTPKAPGIYRVVASTAATEQMLPADSGCDDASPRMQVR